VIAFREESASLEKLDQARFVENRDLESLGLVCLAARVLSRHDVVGPGRNRPRDLAARVDDQLLELIT